MEPLSVSKTDMAPLWRAFHSTFLAALLVLLLSVLLLPAASFAADGKEGVHTLISPGPLASAHAKYDGILSCTKCHRLGGGVPDRLCLDCHDKLDERIKAGRGMHVKYKDPCAKCHSDHKGRSYKMIILEEKKFDHDKTEYKLVDKHQKVECAKCHKKQGEFIGAPKTCVGCHKDEHKKQLDQDCSKCHNIKDWKDITRFDHDRDSVYALTWKHKEVKCAKCHAQGKWKPIEHKKCDACHKDVHKAQFKGQLCDACHTTKDWKADKFKHVPPEYKGYALDGKHLTTPCDKCHVKGAYKPIKSATCDGPGCHPNPHKKQFEGKKCDACHVTAGWGKDAFDHGDPAYKGYKLEGKHHKVKCEECHQKGVYKPLKYKLCEDCHKDEHKGQFKAQKCDSCHTVKDWKEETFDHNGPRYSGYKLDGKHLKTPCDKCHVKGEYKPIKYKACIDCHKDEHKDQFKGRTCESCHDTKDWKKTSFDHNSPSYKGYKLDGKHLKTPCDKCHINAKWRPLPDGCNNCHEKDDTHKQELGSLCGKCHNTTDWKKYTLNHNTQAKFPLIGKHKDVKCEKCHPESKKPKRYRTGELKCVDCHKDVHKGKFKEECSSCHNQSDWVPKRYDHGSKTGYQLSGAHEGTSCGSCHKTADYKMTKKSCFQCHNDPHDNQFGKVECSECHTQASWSPMQFRHTGTRYPLTGAHRAALCGECHKGGNFRNTATVCSNCHMDKYAAAPSHVAKSYGTNCSACHIETMTAWGFKHPGGTDCASCHLAERPATHTSNTVRFPATCATCHKYPAWTPSTFNHLAKTDCSACHGPQKPSTHTANAVKYPVTCETCHKYPAWTPSIFTHASTTNCSACHAPAKTGDPYGQQPEVPDELRAVPQAPVVDAVDLHAPDDGCLLDLPPLPEACDAHRELDAVPDYLLELPQVPVMGDGIACRHDD